MEIVCISDTHGKHQQLQLPKGDMLLHAGDVSSRGSAYEVKQFLEWFEAQPYQYKVFIAGNHDFLMEDHPEQFREMLPDSVIYLENEAIEIEGLKFWGSPVTPRFFDWAFNRDRGADIRRYWEKIPSGVDVVITHGPPLDYGDQTAQGERVGCSDLKEIILGLAPRYHIFGHIHEGYGMYSSFKTTLINASILNLQYQLVNAPVVINVTARNYKL